jgi:hypothetical protein
MARLSFFVSSYIRKLNIFEFRQLFNTTKGRVTAIYRSFKGRPCVFKIVNYIYV